MKDFQIQYMTYDENDGFYILKAPNRERAIAIAESDNPDWIICDALPLDE